MLPEPAAARNKPIRHTEKSRRYDPVSLTCPKTQAGGAEAPSPEPRPKGQIRPTADPSKAPARNEPVPLETGAQFGRTCMT